jgi:transposase
MPVEFIRNTSELVHKVVTLHFDGWSIRSLSRHFQLGRNRVRRMIREHGLKRDEGQTALPKARGSVRKSKLDEYKEAMRGLLAKYPEITAVRLCEELRQTGYAGGITIVREWLRRTRPRAKREPVVRFQTEPGEQGQMDWSPYTVPFTGCGKKTVLCFSYILGFSRRQYIDFTLQRDFHTLIRRHVDAFEHYGGLPRHCLYDNEKTVVLRWEAGRPVFNPSFIDFITHYQCRPVACRPGRAQTKGKIERPFQYVEGNLLNARDFVDFEDLRSYARYWLAEKSDVHMHETTRRTPLELFMTEEKNRLVPLPQHPYDCSQVALRVCSLDGFLELETNRYSVPYEHVGDILAMKATEKEVFVYNSYLELIATHSRQAAGQGVVCEETAHRVTKVRYGLEPVRETFERLGENAKSFLAGLTGKHPKNGGFHARRILLLRERYDACDIDLACGWASRYQAFDAGAIERILLARAIPRTLEAMRNEKARSELEKKLPPIKQRNLTEYSQLLRKDNENEEQRTNTEQPAPSSQNPETRPDGEGAGQGIVPGG